MLSVDKAEIEQLARRISQLVWLKVRRQMKKQLEEIHDLEDDDDD